MKFEDELFNLLDAQRRANRMITVNLGGSSGPGGGVGGPPGGIIGKLVQTRVAYDETEGSTLAGSGTLLDNLNHIRYRIDNFVSSGSSVTVLDNGAEHLNISELNFIGTELTISGSRANITISGGNSVTVLDGGIEYPNISELSFIGVETTISGARATITISGGAGSYPPYVLLEQVESVSTRGGEPTISSWTTRNINTISSDDSNCCTGITAGVFTLVAGTYEYFISCPGIELFTHRCRLYDVTNSITIKCGTSESSDSAGNLVSSTSTIKGKMVLAGSTQLRVDHYAENDPGDFGFGFPCGLVGFPEIYAQAEFHKVG